MRQAPKPYSKGGALLYCVIVIPILAIDTVEVWGSSPHGPTISFNELASTTPVRKAPNGSSKGAILTPVGNAVGIEVVFSCAGAPKQRNKYEMIVLTEKPSRESSPHTMLFGSSSSLTKNMDARGARKPKVNSGEVRSPTQPKHGGLTVNSRRTPAECFQLPCPLVLIV